MNFTYRKQHPSICYLVGHKINGINIKCNEINSSGTECKVVEGTTQFAVTLFHRVE